MKQWRRDNPEVIKQAKDLRGAFPECDENDALDLVRFAKAHGRIQEHACMDELSDAMKTEEKNLEETIREIANRNGLRPNFSGDPRGFTVKLHPIKGESIGNTWGGDSMGWGIG